MLLPGFLLGGLLAVTLVSPWAFGWPAAGERQAVLRMAAYGGRSAIKLVPVTDLPQSLRFPSGVDGDVWVVASSGSGSGASSRQLPQAQAGETGMPTPTWTVAVIAESSLADIGGTGGMSGSWPPFFDRLPDRSTPAWWPVPVPTPGLAAAIVLVILALAGLSAVGALVRGLRFALSRGFRRLGRPT